MTGERWVLRLAGVLSVLVGVTLIALSLPAFDRGFEQDCDNMAGECVRMRQKYTVVLLGMACLGAGMACGLNALGFARASRTRPWRYVALGLACVFAAAYVAVDPISHLDHRYTGWLSD